MLQEPRRTPEEIKHDENRELVFLQEQRWKARDYDPKPEAQALEIAQGYDGRDVTDQELRELEPKTGIFKGYVINALLHKLGYSSFEDDSLRPNSTVYTQRAVCPHCGRVLPPEIVKRKDD